MSGQQHIENEGGNANGLSESTLLAYLEGRLAGDELREVELLLAEESMESDALEGLRALDSVQAREATQALNIQLHQALKKKKRRGRRGMMEQKWSWMAVAIMLLLAIVCYAIVWLLKH